MSGFVAAAPHHARNDASSAGSFTARPGARVPGFAVAMAETPPPAQLQPAAAARFAEFARACKAAARAVALYPGSHPAIGASLSRLTEATVRLAESGPFRLEVRADSLLLNGAVAPRPDPAIA